MPRLIPVRLAVACALALVLSLSIAAGAAAKGFSADLRVVGSGGKILAEKTLEDRNHVGEDLAPGDLLRARHRRQRRLGRAAGQHGARAARPRRQVDPAAAAAAGQRQLRLRPGPLRDRRRHRQGRHLLVPEGQPQGGDRSAPTRPRSRPGDDVLFALAESDPKTFAYPDELWLSAPKTATAGKAFTVRAYTYDDKGKRKPASGVKVSGASGPTAADGRTTVTLGKPRYLRASKGDLIPDRAAICVAGKCPRGS